jgi:hypothetical protein
VDIRLFEVPDATLPDTAGITLWTSRHPGLRPSRGRTRRRRLPRAMALAVPAPRTRPDLRHLLLKGGFVLLLLLVEGDRTRVNSRAGRRTGRPTSPLRRDCSPRPASPAVVVHSWYERHAGGAPPSGGPVA